MTYYFYSAEAGLKGMINYKRIKAMLAETQAKAVIVAETRYKVSRDNPVGFIYSCRIVDVNTTQQSINNAYKSDKPVVITGCEYLEDIYTEMDSINNDVITVK